jgi:dTDP-4-dehydrorhamnose 3,5-epimerase
VKSLAIPDVRVIRFARFRDKRGYFTEPFRRSDLDRHPETEFLRGVAFVQSNESLSHPGTIRGLHFQWNPFMGKLVRTLSGHMVDIVLDVRQGSPHYGKALLYDMPEREDEDTADWIWVPPGFAHGNFFPEGARIEYFCSGEYSPGCEAGISPFAEDIDWSLADSSLKGRFDALVSGPHIVSDKDAAAFSVEGWGRDPRSAEFVYGR